MLETHSGHLPGGDEDVGREGKLECDRERVWFNYEEEINILPLLLIHNTGRIKYNAKQEIK